MRSALLFLLGFSAVLARCHAQTAVPAPDGAANQGGKQSAASVPATPAKETRAGISAIAQAQAELKTAEAAHPGNTVEICDALEKLIGLQLDAHLINDESMALVQREVAIAEAGPGTHSPQYAAAIGELAEILVVLDRPGEARPYAEKALDLAAQIFPGTSDFADSAETLGTVCDALGDYKCSLRAYHTSVETNRKIKGDDPFELIGSLSNLASALDRSGDHKSANAALEEALAYAYEKAPNDPHLGIIEHNMGASYSQSGLFEKAIPHLFKSIELSRKLYGDDAPLVIETENNLAALYGRAGQFDLSWKYYEKVLTYAKPFGYEASQVHSTYARSLAAGGRLVPAVQQGLIAARLGRENFVLGARSLPERQALAFDSVRARGLDLALSVLAKHPEMISADVYQEVVRSRALVADEMARRQKNLNQNNDLEVARLLKELDQARSALLALEQDAKSKAATTEAIAEATDKMERAEAAVAQKSAAFRDDERVTAVDLEDVRRHIPQDAVLISYVRYGRSSVEKIDPLGGKTSSYAAIVFHPQSGKLRIFDLGDASGIDPLIQGARRTVDTEMQSGAMGGRRNERAFREAAGALRAKVWDPLRPEFGGAKLLLVVPDGELNLIPFAAFPDGDGYWLDHGPVIHTLSSERDLIPEESVSTKSGLVAIGNPEFSTAANTGGLEVAATTRSATLSCDEFKQVRFHSLPESDGEVRDISAQWQAANLDGTAAQLLGAEATRESFLREAVRGRVLHVATHAFLLSQSCGDGNPLLDSGLVFAGANTSRESSILTAQQIASMDLSGLDWAVLSACNTGAGKVRDGEGVLGLQRAFRVAGARSVIMTLWPVDDSMSRRYMHELYTQRFGKGATTADSIWNASQKLLADRRTAGLSTHPWYWAGFVGSGSWE
jgi:CHAT domain-containing protein/tetratricopeptide (TPR) repeat protein